MTRQIHTKTNKTRVCVWHIRTRVGRYRHVSILTPWWTLRVQLPERRKFWLEHRDPSKEFFCPFSSVTKQILEKLLKNPILLSFRLHVYVKQIILYSLTRIIIYANQLFFILCWEFFGLLIFIRSLYLFIFRLFSFSRIIVRNFCINHHHPLGIKLRETYAKWWYRVDHGWMSTLISRPGSVFSLFDGPRYGEL